MCVAHAVNDKFHFLEDDDSDDLLAALNEDEDMEDEEGKNLIEFVVFYATKTHRTNTNVRCSRFEC